MMLIPVQYPAVTAGAQLQATWSTFSWSAVDRDGKYLWRYWSNNMFVTWLSDEVVGNLAHLDLMLPKSFSHHFLLPPQKTSLTSKCCDCQNVQPEIGFHDWYISENLIWITGAFYQACAAPLKVNEQCGCPANREILISLHSSGPGHCSVSSTVNIYPLAAVTVFSQLF